MAAICNVAARATAAPKVAVRASSKVQARAFLGRTAPLKARVAGTFLPLNSLNNQQLAKLPLFFPFPRLCQKNNHCR